MMRVDANPYAAVALGFARQRQHPLDDMWTPLGYVMLGQCLGAGAAVGYARLIETRR
jgi:hypothetical protein